MSSPISEISISDLEIERLKYAGNVLSQLKTHRDESKLLDVTLIAGTNGQRISAHRVVLSSCSEYFFGMYAHAMAESAAAEVTLNDVHGNDLLPLVKFCYSGTIAITGANVEGLLRASTLLRFDVVTDKCVAYLKDNLEAHNTLGVTKIADELYLKLLIKEADQYTCEHFLEVCEHDEFLTMDIEKLVKLLESDELVVITEESVYDALQKWVQHDAVERNKHMPELLACVRLPYMPLNFLLVSLWDICAEHGHMKYLHEACLFQNKQLSTVLVKPRKSMAPSLVVVRDEPGSLCDTYSRDERVGLSIENCCNLANNFSVLGRSFPRRVDYAIAFFNGKLCIVGGRFREPLGTFECIDLNTNTSMELLPLNRKRFAFGLAVLKDCLYAVGGKDDDAYFRSVERYDLNTKRWHYIKQMRDARCSAGVIAFNDRIYVVGGYDGDKIFKSVTYYDPILDEWKMCANMNYKRYKTAVATRGGYLYVAGGCRFVATKTSTVERYDPRTDKWTSLCRLNYCRCSHVSVFLGNRLFVFAGQTDETDNITSVEEYDTLTNFWTLKAPSRKDYKPSTWRVVLVPYESIPLVKIGTYM